MSVSRIVVAVDGSPDSLDAVHWAAQLAAACRAEVTLVHACGLLEHLAEGSGAPGRHPAVEALMEEDWSRPLALAGILGELKAWAEQHMPAVEQARAEYDAGRDRALA